MWKLLHRIWYRKFWKKPSPLLTARYRPRRVNKEMPKRAATPDLFFSIAGSVSVCLNDAYALPAHGDPLVARHGFVCRHQPGTAGAVGATAGHPGNLPRSGKTGKDGRIRAD